MAAHLVVAGVYYDSEYPGQKRRVPFESVGRPIDFYERLLHGVFGIGGISENVVGKVLHSGTVHLEKALICGAAASSATLRQVFPDCPDRLVVQGIGQAFILVTIR
jgi:hypothetical protein